MAGKISYDEFYKAVKKIPPPVSCFSNGVACPWCGYLHRTISFSMNNCEECGRAFAFGYPEFHSGDDPVSWVPFPWREFHECGEKASLLEDWKPNERLQRLYFQKAEERLGVSAEENPAQ